MIALAQGENKIRIAVYDSDANEAEQELAVICNTPNPAEAEDMPASTQVTIFTPANESVVSLPFTLLSGEAKGKERIINVRVFVNGAELPMARDLDLVRRHPKDAGGEPPYKIDRRVPLRVGRNSVKLVAETASGKTGEKYIVVNRIGEPVNRPTAPQVAIYEPKNGLQTTEASINLRGEVFGDDLALITVSFNSTDLIYESNPLHKPFPIQKAVELAMGENQIEIHAETAAGETTGETTNETYTVTR